MRWIFLDERGAMRRVLLGSAIDRVVQIRDSCKGPHVRDRFRTREFPTDTLILAILAGIPSVLLALFFAVLVIDRVAPQYDVVFIDDSLLFGPDQTGTIAS